MRFEIGDIISVRGEQLKVAGKIAYKNIVDGCFWDEYRLFNTSNNVEKWLSIDELYKEYSISVPAERNFPKERYHEVDRGVEQVVSHAGSVDVDTGEQARFIEYEDATEEYIYSEESWSDGTERFKGIYVEENEIQLISHDDKAAKKYSRQKMDGEALGTVIGVVAFFVAFCMGVVGSVEGPAKKISKFLKDSPAFIYETSITGTNKEKADVYSTSYDVDSATKLILDGIDGNTESVQQNDGAEDNSVAILTKKEYCLVYESEEGMTMVQVSNRKYAYTSYEQPYHSRRATYGYYRRYYYWRGYDVDSRRYRKKASPYTTYGSSGEAGAGLGSDYGDVYNTYSRSVRQASQAARESSGGGTSYGK